MSNVIMVRFTPSVEPKEDLTDEDAREIANDFFDHASELGKQNFLDCVVNDDRIMGLVWELIAAKPSQRKVIAHKAQLINIAGFELATDMIKDNIFDMGRA